MAKIAIGGPPHSGKTVLMGLLRVLLPRDKFAVVEAAPDGQGITGWWEGHPELVKAVRRKGKFLENFVGWVVDSVRNSRMPITLVDLGGMLLDEAGNFTPTGVRLTPQNERIIRECDGLVVIANPHYAEAAARWLAEGERLGAKPIAVLESVLEGADDEVFSADLPLRARITKLEWENPPVGSLTARAVADLLLQLAGNGEPAADGSEAADVNFPLLAEGLNLPVRNGGPDRDWFPGIIPQLVAFVQAATSGRDAVNLWGNCSAGFPYHALACGLPQRVRYFDPKVGSYVALPDVEPSGEGSQVLDWRVEERDDYSFVEFTIPRQIFDVAKLPLVIPPAVAQGKGVVLSGKGPWWLTGTICRAYHRAGARWVAVFTPQESARRDSEGQKWSEKFPGLAPAVVIASSDSTVPVGSVTPFRLPG